MTGQYFEELIDELLFIYKNSDSEVCKRYNMDSVNNIIIYILEDAIAEAKSYEQRHS